MADTTTRYVVAGMTCEHCVRAVRDEISKLPGVAAVAVDLDTGAVTVTSTERLDGGAVTAAVEKAGYRLTS